MCCCYCCCLVTKSCPTLFDPLDYSLLDSSAPGISQGRILEWVAISFSRGSSQLRDQIRIVCIAGAFFTAEPPGKPQKMCSFLFLHLISRNAIFPTLSFYTLPAFKPRMTITSSKKLYPSALGDRFFPKSLCLLKPIGDLIVLLCCTAHPTLTEHQKYRN